MTCLLQYYMVHGEWSYLELLSSSWFKKFSFILAIKSIAMNAMRGWYYANKKIDGKNVYLS